MGSPHHLTPARAALLCGAAAVTLPLSSACSGAAAGNGADGADGAHSAHGAAASPATIEQLAARTGCALSGKRGSEELRQGACRTAKGRYTLVSFTTDRGRDAWLEEARPWGGSYLVGTRWVAVGAPRTLESLRADLGGHVMNGDHHG
ncbi:MULTISPECIES: hypothetical protein [Actinomadura]|uniref:Lipoprotein n=1 Tax=Actinomadura yumaensis TaxID=111807 RepID=A0ABW2CWS8_9ACTN|nr:hypothetical protein [Actinomadura sp. J1-007]